MIRSKHMTRAFLVLIAAFALNAMPSAGAAGPCRQTLLFHEASGAPVALCAGETEAVSAPAQASIEGDWTLAELGGKSIPRGSEETPSINFAEEGKRASGSTGCNRFSGTYKLDGEQLSFGPSMSTRRACPDPAGEVEAAFEQALGKTVKHRVTETALVLLDGDGAAVAKFVRAAKHKE